MAASRNRRSGSEELVGALLTAAAIVLVSSAVMAAVVGAALVDAVRFAHDRLRSRPTRGLRLTRAFVFRVRHRHAPVRVESLGELLSLTPSGFEEAVAQSLRDRGYRNVKRIGGPGDLGVDVTCVDPNGERLAIQCKRYAPGNRVGSRDIQLFIGMTQTEHDVDRGVFVTTSSFTDPARKLAKKHGIRLIDGHNLTEILDPRSLPQLETASPAEEPPVATRPKPTVNERDGFCPTTDEELDFLAALADAGGVELPAEVVRPLAAGGRRGLLFTSISEMTAAADQLEAAR